MPKTKKSTQPTSEIPIRVVDVDLLRIQDPSWNELLWVDHRTELGRLGPGGELLGLDRFRELKGIMGREHFKLHDVEARLIKTTGKELGGLNWSVVMALLRNGVDIGPDTSGKYYERAMSKKEIGGALGQDAEDPKIAEKVDALFRSWGGELKRVTHTRYLVPLESMPKHFIERFKKHVKLCHGVDL